MTIQIQPVDGHELGDVTLAAQIGEKLNKHYPGHLWAVKVDSERSGGIVTIQNFAVSFKYGYVLKLSRVQSDPDLKCVLLAGGEILERAKMKRGWWNGEDSRHTDGIPDKHQPVNGIII